MKWIVKTKQNNKENKGSLALGITSFVQPFICIFEYTSLFLFEGLLIGSKEPELFGQLNTRPGGGGINPFWETQSNASKFSQTIFHMKADIFS